MNTKYVSAIVIVIIAIAAVAGYLAYSGAFNNTPPSASPSPTPSSSSTPTATPTGSPGTSPTPTGTATPAASPTPTTSTPPTELRIFIASSLTNVVKNMTAQFEKDNNVKLVINSASSGTLYNQIKAGSPCDVFMSADNKWTNNLITDGLLYQNTYSNFTTNSLEIILAPGNPANIQNITDLANSGVKLIIGNPASVPAGTYANTTILKVQNNWGIPNFYSNVFEGIAFGDSVEQVVGAVSLNTGQYDAGIVFVSDGTYGQMTGSQATFVPIPSSVNTRGYYGIATINTSSQTALAQKFVDFWNSQQGQALLTEFGFNS